MKYELRSTQGKECEYILPLPFWTAILGPCFSILTTSTTELINEETV